MPKTKTVCFFTVSAAGRAAVAPAGKTARTELSRLCDTARQLRQALAQTASASA